MALTPDPWMASLSLLRCVSPKVGASGIHSKITRIFIFVWVLLFYFGFHGKQEKVENTLREIRIRESLLCSAHWLRARLDAGRCCLEDSSAAYCVDWKTALLSLQDSSNWGMLKSMFWILGYYYNVPKNTVFHGANWQISQGKMKSHKNVLNG